MVLADVLKYLNGFCVVIHKNLASTNETSSLSDNALKTTEMYNFSKEEIDQINTVKSLAEM